MYSVSFLIKTRNQSGKSPQTAFANQKEAQCAGYYFEIEHESYLKNLSIFLIAEGKAKITTLSPSSIWVSPFTIKPCSPLITPPIFASTGKSRSFTNMRVTIESFFTITSTASASVDERHLMLEISEFIEYL